ncbi:ACT domain protein [Candidatus Methanoplasma termitum]|uniref:ACT domain protein n=1 Tax=Candidatus Methanoplasma termitum TaxID=1577791 RepID=A0A0A7LBR1_9ARCH|nr:ACT domain-containing protein [Candidatus Methanoplasma termitum]AIZ56453.1 ACT domain protein [Candidatus Methanoplasma termitum]MCL2333553.1 ACT domain-containing protein [Candidatus Methanoplasma sp.]
MENENIITQLSIFVSNEPGRLAAIASVLGDFKINIKGFNLAESSEFGILRTIVDEPDRAFEQIRSKGMIVKKTDMIAVALGDSPGSFFVAADVLGRSKINVEYAYAYSGKNLNYLFVKVDDIDKAIKVLKEAKIRLIKRSEI